MMDPDLIESLEIQLKIIKDKSARMNTLAYSRKTTGKNYKIKTGYSVHMRRPVRDLLHWMDGVETMLESIIEEMGDHV